METKKRGRPPLSEEEKSKREPVSFRATPEVKEKVITSAEASGRSVAQEIELRLEQSFAREVEAGGRSIAILADFVRLAAGMIEAQTGKLWTEDADTYFRVQKAITAFMSANHPPAADYMTELEESVAAMPPSDQLAHTASLMEALRGEPQNAQAVQEGLEQIERLTSALEAYHAVSKRNAAAGIEAATTLGHIFQLRSKPVEEVTAPAKSVSHPGKRYYVAATSRKPARAKKAVA